MKATFLLWLLCWCRRSWQDTTESTVGQDTFDDVGDRLYLTPLIESGNLQAAKLSSRVGDLGPVNDVLSYSGFITVDQYSGSNLFFCQDTFDDVGDQLYLTPLIESGDLQAAKLSSRVGYLGPVNDVLSYSGFITVDKYSGSNLFFWFFPAMENPETAPVILWLQGGPGASSLFGLFVEHGPYLVSRRGRPKRRRVTWARRFSMLYVDSPVGAGFSFTERDQGYARSQEDVARDLFEALQQFFTLFVEYAANDFYIAGEAAPVLAL
ncbi:serine carboxypeptidase, putative [Ixodes scapularis]|uniref:Serine carboxypeptidase, putative n=1 Tax=Ixodes scapularis TaxID=6945 RepID=B7PCY9_IXOSC|nr:serine carboxypeptidase, putative [Ixodes scapularis]|eukprot:XP_002410448.1 serine carboxypeptidase, putative [Ixodes scapularis]